MEDNGKTKERMSRRPNVEDTQGIEDVRASENDRQGSYLSRRTFVSGMTLGALALAGGLTACASKEETENGSTTPPTIAETIDVDIVVVGAGASGLSCAVQASEDGNKVLVLESGENVGGNCNGTEGVFAVNSSLQEQLGIHIEPVDIVSRELQDGQYRSDASLWIDMIAASGENIAWLQAQGVVFNGVVDNYHTGEVNTMHWFTGEFGGGGANYVPPMAAAAERNGAEIRTKTRATSLVVNNGVVSGVYAEDPDGNTIQVNAKAVVLASGGIGYNKDLLTQQGWTGAQIDRMQPYTVPTIVGDGYKMAMEVGAKDFLPHSCDQVFNRLPAYAEAPALPLANGGPVLWVNQDARRFTNEAIWWINLGEVGAAAKNNRDSYVVYDQAILDSMIADDATAAAVEAALTPDNEAILYAADTIEALAEHFALDAEALAATVERYNTLCQGGKDLDIGKDVQFMKALETPPYYMARIDNLFVAIDGGITTNVRAEVLDGDLNTIPGLYAVGLDGAMLWRNIYTQNIPGTLMGNNVNSGRNAARNAKKYISTI